MDMRDYWDHVRGSEQALHELHEETTNALAERGRGVRRPPADSGDPVECAECAALIPAGRRLCRNCEQGEL